MGTKKLERRKQEFATFLRLVQGISEDDEVIYTKSYSVAENITVFTPTRKPKIVFDTRKSDDLLDDDFNVLSDRLNNVFNNCSNERTALWLINKRHSNANKTVNLNVITDLTSRVIDGESVEWKLENGETAIISGGTSFLYCFLVKENVLSVMPWFYTGDIKQLENLLLNSIHIIGFEWRI